MALTTQFEQFLALDDVKKIVSFDGWDFSTDVDAYMIFREGVTEENGKSLAQNVADFVSDNDHFFIFEGFLRVSGEVDNGAEKMGDDRLEVPTVRFGKSL
ncbi:glycoside hydrolase [Penicillium odoratum]|uniref:glycoside hydrolase n=1 Tax=Penicillium odoratum TaxID=1167516 RepID=UPI0025472ACF|nr:glycoside hydrolase [Penicillium odoratum]KAJ5772710.1 glycoside hydrolase [Penicillium odoratum]